MRTTVKEVEAIGNNLAEVMNNKTKHEGYTYQYMYGWGLMKMYDNGGMDYVICARGHKETDYKKLHAAMCVMCEV